MDKKKNLLIYFIINNSLQPSPVHINRYFDSKLKKESGYKSIMLKKYPYKKETPNHRQVPKVDYIAAFSSTSSRTRTNSPSFRG